MRYAIVSLLWCAALTASATAFANDAAVLRTQAESWDRDIVRKDRVGIERNLHPKFFQIDTSGMRHERADFIEALLDPGLEIDPYTVPDLEIHQYGDTALVTGTTKIKGRHDGKPFASHYRYIDTYVREHGHWLVVAVQLTAIVP